jgi:O-antigen/teichoic acid export membrane protein
MLVKNITTPDTRQYLSNKKFAKRSFLLIASKLTGLFGQILIILLYSRHLSYIDYGLYQSVWLYINVISVFALFGLPSILLSVSANNIIVWIKQNKTSFYLTAGILNLLPLIYFFFAVQGFTDSCKLLLIALVVAQNIAIVVEILAVKKEKENLVLITNIIFITGYLLCHLLILYTSYSLPLLLVTLTIMFILKACITIYFGSNILNSENSTTINNLGRQWFYLGLFDTISVVGKWLDKWVILLLLSFSQFAIYFNGAYEIPVFGLMITAVGNVMVIELSKNNDGKLITNRMLFNNSSLLLASIVFPSFAFLLFYHHDFFILIFSNKYTASLPIFFITIFVLPIRITNYSAALQAYNRNDLIAKAALIDLVSAMILMLILYPILQMKGLAIAFVAATYIQTLYYLWQTSKILQEKISSFFPIQKLIVVMLLSVVIMGSAYWIFSKLIYPVNMVGGIIVCALLIIILLYFQLKKITLDFPVVRKISTTLFRQ